MTREEMISYLVLHGVEPRIYMGYTGEDNTADWEFWRHGLRVYVQSDEIRRSYTGLGRALYLPSPEGYDRVPDEILRTLVEHLWT